jgi:hypothetical protein
VISGGCTPYVTVLYAARLSAETAGALGSSGSVALTTPLSFCSRATVVATFAAAGPLVTVWPAGASSTTCAVAPLAPEPNFCPRMSSAVVDSWPGIRNVSTVLPDSVAAPTPAATSSSSHTPTTAARCR